MTCGETGVNSPRLRMAPLQANLLGKASLFLLIGTHVLNAYYCALAIQKDDYPWVALPPNDPRHQIIRW